MYGSGFIDDQNEFHFEFNDQYFLRPMICGLHDHFPSNPPSDFFPFPYPYEKFIVTPE
jgi:hypothetical protein